jgi:hypothetical protein
VNFLNPNSEVKKTETLFNSLKEDGFGADPGEEEQFIANLVNRGVTYEEAQEEYKLESFLSKVFKKDVYLTSAANMKIITGIIVR